MCDQRERLIGYVYDECDAAERAEVQRHLDGCVECRDEIASLRSVREDLLAWDVPDHESVWKPFAPAPAKAWWQQVPRWAMAAAASMVVISGAAGGALAHAFMAHQPDKVSAGTASAATTAVSASDLSAAEQRVLVRMREEIAGLDSRVQLVSSRANASAVSPPQLDGLRRDSKDQMDIIRMLYNNIGDLKKTVNTRDREMQARVDNLQALVLQQAR